MNPMHAGTALKRGFIAKEEPPVARLAVAGVAKATFPVGCCKCGILELPLRFRAQLAVLAEDLGPSPPTRTIVPLARPR